VLWFHHGPTATTDVRGAAGRIVSTHDKTEGVFFKTPFFTHTNRSMLAEPCRDWLRGVNTVMNYLIKNYTCLIRFWLRVFWQFSISALPRLQHTFCHICPTNFLKHALHGHLSTRGDNVLTKPVLMKHFICIGCIIWSTANQWQSLDRYNTLDIDQVFSLDHFLMGQDTCVCCTLQSGLSILDTKHPYQFPVSHTHTHTHTKTRTSEQHPLKLVIFLSPRCTNQPIH